MLTNYLPINERLFFPMQGVPSARSKPQIQAANEDGGHHLRTPMGPDLCLLGSEALRSQRPTARGELSPH